MTPTANDGPRSALQIREPIIGIDCSVGYVRHETGARVDEERRPMKNLIAAIVLAAMITPAYADDGFFPKALFDFFDMLDRSWLGTALKYYDHDPKSWNGVWPNMRRDSVWNNRTALNHEPGGVIQEHVERWQELARSGADVEILGSCYSACTLWPTSQKNGCALALL